MKKTLLPILLFIFTVSIFAQNEVPSATNATAGKLTVKFAVPNPGTETHYCVYITNSANQLVNTLSYQYGTKIDNAIAAVGYADQMTTFWNLIGKVYNTDNFKFVGTVDGSSGSTLLSTAVPLKTVYWGQSSTMATAVAGLPDGNYKVNFEMVKNNANRSYTSATFVKGPATSTPTSFLPNTTTFNSLYVNWTPVNTAINDVELEKMYSVYPNPAISSIFVTGSDIEAVEICSLSGRSIFTSNEQKVNLSKLPKGLYLAVIRAKAGTIVKKIEKR